MDLFKAFTLLLFLATGMTINGMDQSPDSIDTFTRDDRILNNKEYFYWDKGGRIDLNLSIKNDSTRILESLLLLETADGEKYNLVMSVIPGYRFIDLLWINRSDAELHSLPSSPAESDSLTLKLYFNGKDVFLQAKDTIFTLPAQHLRPDQGFRVIAARGNYNTFTINDTKGWRHTGDYDTGDKQSAWFWIILVILVDAIVFIIVHYRRRHQRNLQALESAASEALIDKNSTVQFPKRNAIYLFGELHIFDNDGKEVSCRFSPLLRELFLILLLNTPQGGISSKSLTEMLWLDKDEPSAKNNRSVNIHKLRSLLANVGHCSIERTGGKWQIKFDDKTYIDYYECLSDKIQVDRINHDTIKILAAMTQKGGLLASSDYLWLDPYKSEVSDNLVNTLFKYASVLGDHELPETKLLISDIVFRFDATNEFALRLKCLTYVSMNRPYMAKRAYEQFGRIYKDLYGETFPQSYSSIISHA